MQSGGLRSALFVLGSWNRARVAGPLPRTQGQQRHGMTEQTEPGSRSRLPDTPRMERVRAIIEPSLDAMGYEVVRLHETGGQRPVVQVMADRQDGAAMTVDDCAAISRSVSALLDVEDPIPTAYTLEVSSPGIDRPLTRFGDFARFAGFDARIELTRPHDGRRRFKGRLVGTADGAVRLEAEGAVLDLPFAAIQRARLILTDALIAASGTPHDETTDEGEDAR